MLDGCTNITDAPLLAIALSCRKLQEVNLSGCGRVRLTCLRFKTLIRKETKGGKCRRLQLSSIRGVTMQVTDAAVAAIASSCGPGSLRVLELKRCLKLTDVGLCQIGEHCRVLEVCTSPLLASCPSSCDGTYHSLSLAMCIDLGGGLAGPGHSGLRLHHGRWRGQLCCQTEGAPGSTHSKAPYSHPSWSG